MKPGIKGQTKWFEMILEKSFHPIMAYNIPGRVGVKLYNSVIKDLKSHPKLRAIKNSTNNIEDIINYKIAAPNISIYCGEDYLMPSMAIEGAEGLISVASNAWPNEIRNYVKKCLNLEKFKDKFWWECCKSLFSTSNPIPIKALLKDINIINYDNVRTPLSMLDLKSRDLLLNF